MAALMISVATAANKLPGYIISTWDKSAYLNAEPVFKDMAE